MLILVEGNEEGRSENLRDGIQDGLCDGSTEVVGLEDGWNVGSELSEQDGISVEILLDRRWSSNVFYTM